jgi:hypothetical protein
MMPKIPKKKKASKSTPKMSAKDFADNLLRINNLLIVVRSELTKMWTELYTRGLSDCGPLSEDDSDIPF